jgi:hypothetical protein
MIMSLRIKLTALLLLVTVFLVPLNSFAHTMTSGVVDSPPCACQLADCHPDERGGQPENYPDSNGDDCCDCEGCCPDATEPPVSYNLRINISTYQHFHPYANGLFLEVYLTIFVPPENSSLA